MSRIAIYVRTSTTDQNVDGQILAINQFCDSQPYADFPRDVYVEQGVSARKVRPENRPVFSKILKKCESGYYSHVAILRIDRLCRNVRDLYDITQKFKDMKIELVFTQQQIDTSGAVGQLIMSILGAIAEFEANLIAQRIMEGLDLRRSLGVKLGRPKAHLPSEDTLQAFIEHCQGSSLRDLEKTYKVSRMTLSRRFKEIAEELDIKYPLKDNADALEKIKLLDNLDDQAE